MTSLLLFLKKKDFPKKNFIMHASLCVSKICWRDDFICIDIITFNCFNTCGFDLKIENGDYTKSYT